MKQFIARFLFSMLLVLTAGSLAFSQGGGATSALSGVVVDSSGGVIPGADVTVRNNDTGSEFKTVTAGNGTFSIPALNSGTYTATVTVPNFKQAVVKDIKLEAGVPGNVRITMEVGGSSETVVVEAGAEMVQSQTANVTTTMSTSQIINLPLITRNALDFVVLLPGVNTPASGNRDSRVMGLPESFVNITIDGVSSMDNYNRTSDGFFSRVQPSLDAIQEVTVSTATPGAESGGQGAVQIKFVTRSGNNDYHGSLYEYHRNPALNANYWFDNRDVLPPAGENPLTWKAPPPRILRNQFGGRVGGPITIPKLFSGRDRAFFFVNIEELRQPNQVTRNQTIFVPEAEQGNFVYNVSGVKKSVNLLDLASTNGQVATWDPTIQKLLADIRTSTAKGSLNAQSNPLYQTLTFINKGMNKTRFYTSRFDFNLTSRHRLEAVYNYHQYFPLPYDNTNDGSPAYPDFPNYRVQGSNRFMASAAVRSTITPRIVNEGRFGLAGGTTLFSPNISPSMFGPDIPVADQGGYALGLSAAGVTNAYRNYTPSRRNAPSRVFEDTLSWTKGSHSLSFGATWTQVGMFVVNQVVVPGISFGLNTTYDPARFMFDSSNGSKNFPGSSNTQVTSARNMYALLTGRVSQITGTAYLNEDTNQYTYNGNRVQRGHMRDLGFFAADSWRVRPGLTLNYGLRWEFQYPFVPGNDVYTTATVADVWGVSGYNNLFKPGTLTGKVPEFVQYKSGTPGYNLSYKDFAPSFGFAWSPSAKSGWLGRMLGSGGETVIRGGYSMAYSRMGMGTYADIFNGNPGSFVTAIRNTNLGNLVSNTGTDVWPLLFRERSRLGPPSFPTTPTYPMKGAVTNSVTIMDPNIHTPYGVSWTFGIQRELNKSMALEVRYVGTRGMQNWTEYDLNEDYILENGLLDEFKLAMTNLQANIAAKRGNTFKYAGPGTGTSPLPITLAYFSGYPASQAGDATKYNSSNFTNTTWVNTLASTNPSPYTYETNLWSDSGRRANALAAGLPANLFIVNPDLQGGANIAGSGGKTYYDAMVIELRRRMAKGLLIQANYTWAKVMGTTRLSMRVQRVKDLSNSAPHAFKLNWVYELPFGNGRTFLSNMHPVVDNIFGGWDF